MQKSYSKLLLIIALFISAYFFSASPIYACSCPMDENWLPPGPHEKIFLGRVLDAKQITSGPELGNSRIWIVTFSAPIKWLGDVNPIETVAVASDDWGGCGFSSMPVGREMVLYVQKQGDTDPRYPYPFVSACFTTSLAFTEERRGKGEYVGSICPQISEEVPQSIQQRALRYPHEFRDWGRRDGAPFYSWYKRLSLMDLGKPYNPMYNSPVWKSGCY
ncbi:MAG: hypothetical protein UZ22_OP11002000920 [Microgenomates bacterium OLB23]|nr:MAG: hypothetical protein UZ22_OP11002000920 [Microgenomates bacterium OLB23]